MLVLAGLPHARWDPTQYSEGMSCGGLSHCCLLCLGSAAVLSWDTFYNCSQKDCKCTVKLQKLVNIFIKVNGTWNSSFSLCCCLLEVIFNLVQMEFGWMYSSCAVLSMLVKCKAVHIQVMVFVEWANKCICSFYLTDKKNKI